MIEYLRHPEDEYAIDEAESQYKRDDCPLAGGPLCCEDCRECEVW